MKKLILSTACVMAIASSAFAQGNLAWNLVSPAAMTAATNSTTYSSFFGGGSTGNGASGFTGLAATGFYYELLQTGSYNGSTNGIAPTSLSGIATWTDTGLLATNSVASAGKLAPFASNAGATVSSMNPGTTNYIMLVGWSSNLGTTWSSALAALQSSSTLANVVGNAFFGISNIGFITPLSSATSPGAAVFGTANTAQGTPINSLNTQLYLVPVPEPSTMVLAGLGGLSLLAFRRKK